MKVLLDEGFFHELQAHYHASVTADTYVVNNIHCWAFNADGRELENVVAGTPIFEFCIPNTKPIYAVVDNNSFLDTENYCIIKNSEVIERGDLEEHVLNHVEKDDCGC